MAFVSGHRRVIILLMSMDAEAKEFVAYRKARDELRDHIRALHKTDFAPILNKDMGELMKMVKAGGVKKKKRVPKAKTIIPGAANQAGKKKEKKTPKAAS